MDKLVVQMQDFFSTHQWTLSVAESCTGGSLAARLTKQPDCSTYFLGGVISYSNALKTKLLSVNPVTLEQHGAVSGPVVGEMAQGMLELSGSDYSLAVSGIAGPSGGSLLKPVGLIWAAIGRQAASPFIWSFQLTGTRTEIIEKATENLLSQLWLLIKT